MAITKLVNLERLTYFKGKQDAFNEAKFLGIEANAVSATKLQTARTIDGVSFDGQANITLPTKIVRVYSETSGNTVTFYTDAAKQNAFSADADADKKLYIDVTAGKAAFWNGSTLQYVEAADTTPRIALSEKGQANGVATLDSTGIIPADQLPSYVDDVIEVYVTKSGTGTDQDPVVYSLYKDQAKTQAVTGETGKIYYDLQATIDGCYRWTGTAFIPVGTNVSTADAAVKATQDGNGDTIATTYVKVQTGKDLMTDTQASQLAGLVSEFGSSQLVTESEIDAIFATTPAEPEP